MNGAQGPAGPAGPSGVVATGTWSGVVAGIAANNTWTFAGPFAVVTTAAGQRLTASGSMSISLTANAVQNIDVGVCYQNNAAPAGLTNFTGGSVMLVEIQPFLFPYAVSASTVPGAGQWRVGMCVRNPNGNFAVNFNDEASGWVQVTN
jgi:hypothetical protein